MRVLSNLIDNAVEALPSAGEVCISLHPGDGNEIECLVSDNGAGIPVEILPKLMQRGASFGKKKGSGLGLHHARETIQNWGGRVELSSEMGTGTCVRLCLPQSPVPTWFLRELQIPNDCNIVIFDDDPSIHEIWRQRFNSENLRLNSVRHCYSSHDLRMEVRHPKTGGPSIYLVDHDVGDKSLSGLQLIEELSLVPYAMLVTNRHDEGHLRHKCETLGIKILPKGLASTIPISNSRN